MATWKASALAVKELEPGEFHWILMQEEDSEDEFLSYSPAVFSKPHRDEAAAWSAGYLVLRAMLRKASQ